MVERQTSSLASCQRAPYAPNSSPTRRPIIVGSYIDDVNAPRLERVLVSQIDDAQLATLPADADLVRGDPQFVAPAEGNYRLRPSSPAVDAGNGGPARDHAGQTRDGAPDLGAFELVR